jgi:hypothetical protein
MTEVSKMVECIFGISIAWRWRVQIFQPPFSQATT